VEGSNHCAEGFNSGVNPLTTKDLKRRRAMSPLKIKILSKNLGRQRFAEGFNSGVNPLTPNDL
jgi:hypothetical protein